MPDQMGSLIHQTFLGHLLQARHHCKHVWSSRVGWLRPLLSEIPMMMSV
jgi:hypothetical protein